MGENNYLYGLSKEYCPDSQNSSRPKMRNLHCLFSKFMTIKVLFIITFVLSKIPLCGSRQTSSAKKEVVMQIIVPFLSKFERKLLPQDLLEKEIDGPNRWKYYTLLQNFTLDTFQNFTENLNPNEILGLFCTEIFEKNVNVITLINYKWDSEASNAYILRLADHLGYPMINWDTEYPGALQSNEDSRVLQIAPTLYHQCQGMIHLLDRYNWTEFTIVTTKISSNMDFVECMEEMVKLRGVTHGYITKYRFTLSSVIEIDLEYEKDLANQIKIHKALSGFKQNTVRVFLLHAKSDEAKNILDQAAKMGLTSEIYIWILTSSSMGVISETASPSYPIGSLGFSSNRSVEVVKEAINTAIKVWALGLEGISSAMGDLLARTTMVPNMTCNSSLLNGFWNDGKTLYTYMKKINLEDPPVSFADNGVIKHTTIDIYNFQPFNDKTSRKMSQKWEPVGKFLPEKSSTGDIVMEIQMNEIIWPGRSLFPPKGRPDRRVFKIATLSEPPYVIYVNPDETTGKCGHHSVPCQVNATRFPELNASYNGDVCCTGLCIDLVTMLSETLDFDFVMYEVNDTMWGIKNEKTGEWNGLIRELVDHKSDFVMTSLKINHQRSSAIDFSVPFLETGITIIVSIRKGAISPTAFLEPLDLTSWLFILMLSINIVALTICLMEWYSPQAVNTGKGAGEPYDYPSWCLILIFSVHATGASIFIFEWLSPSGLDHGKTPLREHKFSLFRSFWLIWAMLFGVSVSVDNPRGVSSRFLANVWALFALVFLASYTANLAAFMITIDDYYKLSGIQDWRLMNPTAMTPHFRFATVSGGSTEENLKTNYPQMHKYMMKYNKSTVQEGIHALKRQEIHAFIYDATVLEYREGNDSECELKTVGKWYALTGYGIGFPRGSKYIDEINKVLLELQNNGEMERLQKFWLAGACHARKDKKKDQSSHEIGILNFTSAFILLVCGIVMGTILLGLEHSYFRFGRKCLKEYDKCGCCALVSLSMGKSLTFEESVIEAIDFHKKHPCKDAVCQTQLWKARHELDLALLKIERLRRELTMTWKSIEYPTASQEAKTEPNGITAQYRKIHDSDKDDDTKSKIDDDKSDRKIMESKSEINMEPDMSEVEWKRTVFGRSPSYTNAMSCESKVKPGDCNPEVRRSPSYTQAIGKDKYDPVNLSEDNTQDRPKKNARLEDETSFDSKNRPKSSNRTRFNEGNYYIRVEDVQDESSL